MKISGSRILINIPIVNTIRDNIFTIIIIFFMIYFCFNHLFLIYVSMYNKCITILKNENENVMNIVLHI